MCFPVVQEFSSLTAHIQHQTIYDKHTHTLINKPLCVEKPSEFNLKSNKVTAEQCRLF